MNVVLTLLKREISFKVCQRTTGGVRYRRSEQVPTRGQEDKDEEDERTRMRRTRMIFQDSISRKMYDVDRVGKRFKDEKKETVEKKILKF